MDRKDFFYKQVVTESDLDQAFDAAEAADQAIVSDLGLIGICEGGDVVQTTPATLNVEVGGPLTAYDPSGRRIRMSPDELVDCSVDENTNPTTVAAGNERWLSVFVEYHEDLSDPRYDGNGVLVYTTRAEGYSLYVVMGPEVAIGAATKPSKAPSSQHTSPLLLADVRIYDGQPGIETADIDVSRRDVLFIFVGDQITVTGDDFDAIFQALATIIDDHIDADAWKHNDEDVVTDAYDPGGGQFELTGASVEAQLQETADGLDAVAVDHVDLRSEVTAARGTEADLDTRLDEILEGNGELKSGVVEFQHKNSVRGNGRLNGDQSGIVPGAVTVIEFDHVDANLITMANGVIEVTKPHDPAEHIMLRASFVAFINDVDEWVYREHIRVYLVERDTLGAYVDSWCLARKMISATGTQEVSLNGSHVISFDMDNRLTFEILHDRAGGNIGLVSIRLNEIDTGISSLTTICGIEEV